MKTFIIATALCVGVLLRPQVAPSGPNPQMYPNTAALGASVENENAAQPLSAEKLAGIRGAGIFNCEWIIENNVVYGRCCAGLWIFRVCIYVEVGDIPPPPTK